MPPFGDLYAAVSTKDECDFIDFAGRKGWVFEARSYRNSPYEDGIYVVELLFRPGQRGGDKFSTRDVPEGIDFIQLVFGTSLNPASWIFPKTLNLNKPPEAP